MGAIRVTEQSDSLNKDISTHIQVTQQTLLNDNASSTVMKDPSSWHPTVETLLAPDKRLSIV